MPFGDEIFRQEIDAAAAALGTSATAVLKQAGVGKSGLGTKHAHSPRVDLFEKLMPILGWSPADALRFIATCFEWPAADEIVDETGVSREPLIQTTPRGEVRIVLKNVEVRVLSSDD